MTVKTVHRIKNGSTEAKECDTTLSRGARSGPLERVSLKAGHPPNVRRDLGLFVDQGWKEFFLADEFSLTKDLYQQAGYAGRKYLGDCDLFRFTPEISARETVARVTVTPGAGASDATLDTVLRICSNENGHESRSSEETLRLPLDMLEARVDNWIRSQVPNGASR